LELFSSSTSCGESFESIPILGYTSIITHSLKELITEPQKRNNRFKELKDKACFLDMFYIPTRYPNGLLGNLATFEFYEEEDAKKCIDYTESILMTVRKFING